MRKMFLLLTSAALCAASTPGFAAKPVCEVYCNAFCQRGIAKGIYQPANLSKCVAVCTSHNRGGLGGGFKSHAGGKCT